MGLGLINQHHKHKLVGRNGVVLHFVVVLIEKINIHVVRKNVLDSRTIDQQEGLITEQEILLLDLEIARAEGSVLQEKLATDIEICSDEVDVFSVHSYDLTCHVVVLQPYFHHSPQSTPDLSFAVLYHQVRLKYKLLIEVIHQAKSKNRTLILAFFELNHTVMALIWNILHLNVGLKVDFLNVKLQP